jgi:hypothetical protein
MKKPLSALAGVLTLCCIPASAALVAGWENWSEVAADQWNPTQLMTATTAVANGTPETGGSWFNFGTNALGRSTDGTWGTIALPAADSTNDQSTDGVALANGYDGFIDFTITDTSGTPRDLTSFNFDVGAFRTNAARNWSLSIIAGDLTNASNLATGTANHSTSVEIQDDIDVSLTGLADYTLDANGTVTFRLNFTGGTNSSAGHHLWLDNVAVFGTAVVPEPSVALLCMLGMVGLFRRRR